MRRASVDLDLALDQRATATDEPSATAADRAAQDARSSHDRASTHYQGAVEELQASLRSVPTWADDDPSVAWHVGAGLDRFLQLAVVEPAKGAAMLALGWVEDPAGWRSMVGAIPASLWDLVTHPRRTVDELLAGEDVRNGQIGAAVGTWLSMAVVPSKALRAMASPEARTKYARHMADPNAPRPRVQTVDEMLAGVDLAAHEHYALGHVVRRHVVDDDYLRDRLRNGTLLDQGQRGRSLNEVSSWSDLATAERSITETLRQHEGRLRTWIAESRSDTIVLKYTSQEPLGRVLFSSAGQETWAPSSRARVVLRREGDEVFIYTAYLDRP
jgi:hypothetical protein